MVIHHLRLVRLYNVRAGKSTHSIWATSEGDAIAKALGMGLPASSARRVDQ